MTKLKDPLFDTTASTEEVLSPISNQKMILAEVNNIPVWVHIGDRVCLPVSDTDKKEVI